MNISSFSNPRISSPSPPVSSVSQTSSGASSAAALGVASCSLRVDATTRERTAKQEGINPVPYLLTVFRPLVSPQLIVSA